MKIYACIPSLNEVATIESVTRFVDDGLRIFCLKHAISGIVKILNIDSSSDDETVRKFNETNTYFPKQSIVLGKPRGKGKNLLKFMKIAYEDKVDYCVTIDADIRSGNSQWINDLLTPLLMDQADFVTPLYERSRFEGSTTNHFAYPVTLALTGVRVRQPIAGDFGFNFALLEAVNKLDIPEGTQYYGIDVFLTLATLMNKLRHKQIDLGSKLHNPSHTKLEYMFPQIAGVELSMLRQFSIKKILLPVKENLTTNITESKVFLHKSTARNMYRDALSYLFSVDILLWQWVPDNLVNQLKKQTEIKISSVDWVNILSNWLQFGLNNKNIDAGLLAKQLLPFFVLRATDFWFMSENMTAKEAESVIEKQAIELYKSFNNKWNKKK